MVFRGGQIAKLGAFVCVRTQGLKVAQMERLIDFGVFDSAHQMV